MLPQSSGYAASPQRLIHNFWLYLEQYGVDLVLSGHSHSYERSYLVDGHYGSHLNAFWGAIQRDSVRSTTDEANRGREGVKKWWGQPAASKGITDKQGFRGRRLWQSPIVSHLPEPELQLSAANFPTLFPIPLARFQLLAEFSPKDPG